MAAQFHGEIIMVQLHSMYPQFRARSGGIRNNCKKNFRLHGKKFECDKAIDSNSKEMKAIIAYMNWLGEEFQKNLNQKEAAS